MVQGHPEKMDIIRQNGGIGFFCSIDGTGLYWGGGGGGAGYTINGGNGGAGGGGGGAVGATTGGAGYNNGSPGGGGATNSQVTHPVETLALIPVVVVAVVHLTIIKVAMVVPV